MSKPNLVEALLRRDRLVVVVALTIILVASWAYILSGAGMGMSAFDMTSLSMALGPSQETPMATGGAMVAMATPVDWTLGYALVMVFMWWVMMIAMMLPSAAPMVLLFAAVNRKQQEAGNRFVPTSLFALAYLVAWAGFSVAAVALQWGLERMALLSPMLVSSSAIVGGVVLLAAGVYQLTPLKRACLKHCRSPLHFVMMHWRSGAGGAFRMGLEHGVYCVGCCWFLMGLLFFGGIMNLYWIAGIAVYVLLEKTVPMGHWLGYLVGAALVGWGIVVLAGAASPLL